MKCNVRVIPIINSYRRRLVNTSLSLILIILIVIESWWQPNKLRKCQLRKQTAEEEPALSKLMVVILEWSNQLNRELANSIKPRDYQLRGHHNIILWEKAHLNLATTKAHSRLESWVVTNKVRRWVRLAIRDQSFRLSDSLETICPSTYRKRN